MVVDMTEQTTQDIVERLRNLPFPEHDGPLFVEAADEIERTRKALAEQLWKDGWCLVCPEEMGKQT